MQRITAAVIGSLCSWLLAITAAHAQGPSFPEQVAGFRFESTTREAARTCRRAGLRWERMEGYSDRFLCVGTPASIGQPAQTIINVCDGRVCGVELVVEAESNGATIAAYADLERELERRYGSGRVIAEARGTQQGLCDHDVRERTYQLVPFGRCRPVHLWRLSGGWIGLVMMGEGGRLSVMVFYGLPESSSRAQDRAL